MIFNNVLNDRSLEEAHARCSFYDPYIGEDAGYLQVTRLNGHGPALLVVPEGKTQFEAYSPILDKRAHGAQSLYSLIPLREELPSKVSTNGWCTARHTPRMSGKPHNLGILPTSLALAPGESKVYGLKFLLSSSIRNIEKHWKIMHDLLRSVCRVM